MKLAFLIVGIFAFLGTTNPEIQNYRLDPTHTFINFKVERFMVGEVTGRFNDFAGEVHYDPEDLSSFSLNVTIQTKSIDTGLELRDGHLKGEMWLDTERFPEIHFVSQSLDRRSDQLFLTADLTIHGMTNQVEFPIEVLGPFKDPTQTTAIGLKGALTLNRQDYGINFSKLMDNGELFIGNQVKIDIQALAIIPKS